MTRRKRVILAACGASGAVHARALLRALAGADGVSEVHVVMSDAGRRVAREELGTRAASATELTDEWLAGTQRRAEVRVHAFRDVGAGPASGSFRHDGMVIVPCSTATLCAIAHGTTANLIHRAADVALKERLPLLLMVRESPLSLVHLEAMCAVTRAGAVVMPPSPPWYHRPRTLDELVDDTIARALDHLGLPELVRRRWQGGGGETPA